MSADKNYSNILFAILFVLLVALESLAAQLGYHNYGWQEGAFITVILMPLNILFAILYRFKQRYLALFCMIALAIYIVPTQFYYTSKYIDLKEEGANIANFVHRRKIQSGEFPDNLKGYRYMYPELQRHFHYSKYRENEWQITFIVASPNTHHIYRNDTTLWFYIDD